MAKKLVKLDLADAQFIGYCAGKDGRIIDMVQSMGLTKSEWMKWKENYTTTYLTDREVKEIDDHFNLSVLERVGF
jgi:hypothetical protein